MSKDTALVKTDTDIDVSLPDRIVAEPEAIEALKRQGMTMVNEKTLGDLETLGIYLKSKGVLRLQRGQAVLNQQRLDSVMRALYERVEAERRKKTPSITALAKLAHAIGYLSKNLTESQKLVLEMEVAGSPGSAPMDDIPPTTNSFKPGQPVIPIQATNVHIHGNVQTEKK